MQEVLLDYGDKKMRVELPDTATVVRCGQTYQDLPGIDNSHATRQALGKAPGFSTSAGNGRPGQKGGHWLP